MNKRKWQKLIKQYGWWEAYKHYLNSPSWRKKRKEVLKRDNYECQTCDNTEGYQLEIHHSKSKAYEAIPNELIDDLIALCAKCHEAITSRIRHQRYQDRNQNIKPNHLEEIQEKELINYGMVDPELQINGRITTDPSQWRFGQSSKSNSEVSEKNIGQARQDRGRFNGIGKT